MTASTFRRFTGAPPVRFAFYLDESSNAAIPARKGRGEIQRAQAEIQFGETVSVPSAATVYVWFD